MRLLISAILLLFCVQLFAQVPDSRRKNFWDLAREALSQKADGTETPVIKLYPVLSDSVRWYKPGRARQRLNDRNSYVAKDLYMLDPIDTVHNTKVLKIDAYLIYHGLLQAGLLGQGGGVSDGVVTAIQVNGETGIVTFQRSQGLSSINVDLSSLVFSGDYNDLSNLPDFTGWDMNAGDDYTTTDFDVDFGGKTTDDLTEGITNLYHIPPNFTESGGIAITGTYPNLNFDGSAISGDDTQDLSIDTSTNVLNLVNSPSVDLSYLRNYDRLNNLPALFDGDYNSLTNKPTTFSGSWNDLTDIPAGFADNTDDVSGGSGTDGVVGGGSVSGDELTLTRSNGLPNIVIPFTGWDTDESDDFSGVYNDLTGKPTLFSEVYTDLDFTGTTGLSDGVDNTITQTFIPSNYVLGGGTITLSNGSNDFSITGNAVSWNPTIRVFTINESDNQVADVFSESAGIVSLSIEDDGEANKTIDLSAWDRDASDDFSGSWNALTDKPTLFTGSWNDLTNIPAGFADNVDDGITTETDPVWISEKVNYYTKAQLQGDGTAAMHWNNLLFKPSFFDGDWNNLTNVPAGFADDIDNVNDADADPTNENQTVSAGTGMTVNQVGQDFEVSSTITDTDEQGVDNFSLLGETLTFELERDGQASHTVTFTGWDTDESDDFSGSWNDLVNVPAGFADDIDDVDDADSDATNELQNLQIVVNNPNSGSIQNNIIGSPTSVVISGDIVQAGAGGFTINGDGFEQDTDAQKFDVFSFAGTVLSASLERDGEATKTVDLSGLQDGFEANTHVNVQIEGATLTDPDLIVFDTDDFIGVNSSGNAIIGIDYSKDWTGLFDGQEGSYYLDNTDDQTIDVFNLNSTTLELSLESDGEVTQTVDLSSLQDGTGTDDQQIDQFAIVSDELRLELEDDGQAVQTVDLSPYLDNTDGFFDATNNDTDIAISEANVTSDLTYDVDENSIIIDADKTTDGGIITPFQIDGDFSGIGGVTRMEINSSAAPTSQNAFIRLQSNSGLSLLADNEIVANGQLTIAVVDDKDSNSKIQFNDPEGDYSFLNMSASNVNDNHDVMVINQSSEEMKALDIKKYFLAEETTSTSGSSTSWNIDNAHKAHFDWDLTSTGGNVTLTVSNPCNESGYVGYYTLRLHNAGAARTITLAGLTFVKRDGTTFTTLDVDSGVDTYLAFSVRGAANTIAYTMEQ